MARSPTAEPPSDPSKATAINGAPADPIRRAVEHSGRPPEDRARDPQRRPRQVLELFGIEPGMTVVELMAGRGYYVEILARAVGPEGTVYAHNSPYVLDKFAEGPLSERLEDPDLSNVVRVDSELDALDFPEETMDAVLMILFYHDTYWMDVDRAAMNRQVYEALEPGGVYGIVDHHAEPGSRDRDAKRLHRIDIELVKREIADAGFVLEGQGDFLRRPDDRRTANVFDESIRGETDRFVLKFRKPR